MSRPLVDLVQAAAAMAATRSRLTKAATLADLLRELPPADLPPAIGLLLGSPVQGRLGLGWRSVQAATADLPAAGESTLTIAEVDSAFNALAQASGTGSTSARAAIAQTLFAAATGDERDFLVRSILGDVRTGALEGVLADAIASAAGLPVDEVRRAAMLSGDWGITAQKALSGNGSAELAAVGLTVGVPVLPMLAASAPTVAEALELTGEAAVEHKLDGARLQIHRRGEQIRCYTRSLADVTDRVPEVLDVVRALPGGDLILDGETLRLDADGKARPFQETMSRFGSAEGAALSVYLFDIVHAGGVDLIDRPYRERRALLEELAPDHVVPAIVGADPLAAQEFFERAIAAGNEGVLVKALDGGYQAGRRGNSWVKVKPVYTFDLVVLAAEWGYGRRTGWLSNLHLGALDPAGRFGEPGGFVMVGKTFKGLTDALLRWQTEYFPTIATRSTEHTVFLQPTTVVEIGIDGVQASTRYPGGVALRFARVKRYRVGDDAKPAADCVTIDELRALLPGGGPEQA